MATTFTFLFSLLSLFSVSLLGVSGEFPPPCKRYECPRYELVASANDFEIRRYESIVLISNSPVQGDSLVGATRTGVERLFSYIHGNNSRKEQIEMTAPVITEVATGNVSAFSVSFYLPKANQENPPSAEGLRVVRLKSVYAAIRQFGGFVTDSNVEKEVAALSASLSGTKWSSAIQKGGYALGQYNSPFKLINRLNEIWFLPKAQP
ncbi:heme-binding protein 2-like [Abrus precatorius]|uniref:Heme-binding protein 2-like n=1 Tax=Abrus precatorius TaxID=3816 RepID=A0A8B8LLI4_ABRPR|nr:heme-binding protein 2-like [Abrus precatorius]